VAQGTANTAYWLMSGLDSDRQRLGARPAPAKAFKIVAAGDYNGDRYIDLAWSNGNQLKFWTNNHRRRFHREHGDFTTVRKWQPFASVDLDSDGKDDLLWRQGEHIAHWLMDGAFPACDGVHRLRRRRLQGGGAAGDFNGDGASDMAAGQRQPAQGLDQQRPCRFHARRAGVTLAETGRRSRANDLNRDGKADLMWRNGSQIAYWAMDRRERTDHGVRRRCGRRVPAGGRR
jgi:hypothetical protein